MPTIEKADKKEHGTSTEGSRYEHVHGQVCPKAENAPGKAWTVGARTFRKERDSIADALRLGVQHKSAPHRTAAGTCESPGNQDSDTLAVRLKKESLRNFKEFAEIRISPIGVLRKSAYNTRITLGSGLKSLPASRVVVSQKSNQNHRNMPAFCYRGATPCQ